MMIKKSFMNLFFILLSLNLYAQDDNSRKTTLWVRPYLQDATPNSMNILWETSSEEESIVEWGLTPKLGNKTSGSAFDINYTDARIHEVQLTGLNKLTMYYYRVKTGKLVSDIYQFKTPPFAADQQAFNLVAMSDMQIDRSNPNKFSEIINQGVLSYLKKEFDGEVPENLALIMIPGDLVEMALSIISGKIISLILHMSSFPRFRCILYWETMKEILLFILSTSAYPKMAVPNMKSIGGTKIMATSELLAWTLMRVTGINHSLIG